MADQRLVDYIRTNLKKGYSKEQLKQVLIQHGHKISEVEEAARMASSGEISPVKKTASASEKKTKDVKWLAVLYGISLALNIIIMVPVLFFAQLTGTSIDLFSYTFITWIVSIVITLIVIIGLLKYAKWGMYLAFAFSIFHIFDGLIGTNFIKIVINAIILYYLYKWRAAFE